MVAVAVVGCGDDGGSNTRDSGMGQGDGATNDGAQSDSGSSCPAPAFGELGGPCGSSIDCGQDGLCRRGKVGDIVYPDEGYCISKFGICNTDTDCGAGNQCLRFDTYRACYPSCQTADCCGAGFICSNRWNRDTFQDAKKTCVPATLGALDGAACTDIGDCAPGSRCVVNAEFPGGSCQTLECSLADDTTCAAGGDGNCVDDDAIDTNHAGGLDELCVDTCVNPTDCRTGYTCFDGGASGKYCRAPHIGDACIDDSSCGDPAIWDCRTGTGYPDGYCTLAAACNAATGAGCTEGSICHDPNNGSPAYCVDDCTGAGTQGTCRTGYTCVSFGIDSGCKG